MKSEAIFKNMPLDLLIINQFNLNIFLCLCINKVSLFYILFSLMYSCTSIKISDCLTIKTSSELQQY